MTSPTWSPDDYLKFADPRARPFADLVARIADGTTRRSSSTSAAGRATSTRTLLDRWPDAHVTGIDADARDDRRRATAGRRRCRDGRLTFALRRDRDLDSPLVAVDVIVSNAALHWVPTHVDLLPRWLDALRPGGTLAFQVPRPADDRAGRRAARGHFGAAVVGPVRWRGEPGRLGVRARRGYAPRPSTPTF